MPYTADHSDSQANSTMPGSRTLATTHSNTDASTDQAMHDLVYAKSSESNTRPGSVTDENGPSMPIAAVDPSTGAIRSNINDPRPVNSDPIAVENLGHADASFTQTQPLRLKNRSKATSAS